MSAIERGYQLMTIRAPPGTGWGWAVVAGWIDV